MYLKVVFLYSTFVSMVLCEKCHGYWNSRSPIVNFGTITPYDDIRGDIRDIPPLPGDCEPVSVWAFIRHGTRYPLRRLYLDMKHMSELKEMIVENYNKKQLCVQDIHNLNNWSWERKINNDTTGDLDISGFKELYNLGSRFHQRFSQLLQNLDQYVFRPSNEQRTNKSAKAFVKGLQQDKYRFNVSKAKERDDIVRPYKDCNRYIKEVYKHSRVTNEVRKYYKTTEFKQLLQSLKERTGLNFTLTERNASCLHDLCRFYRSYSTSKHSPWCALFTDEELQVVEYPEDDLKAFYESGYGGGPLVKRLGAEALKNLYQTFEAAVLGSIRSFTGYFSHDTMLQMIYTALELFKDYQVMGIERVAGRKWKTSEMTPFAANFVSVLHRCPNDVEAYRVQFMINEVEIHLCRDRTCTWKDFTTKFQPFLKNNVDFCYNKTIMQVNITGV